MTIWRYCLTEPFAYDHPVFDGVVFTCEWATIMRGTIIIKAGYAWDGCSPAWRIGCFWLGTPDGKLRPDGRPQTYEASLVHDVLCQFSERVPMSKDQVSDLFRDMLLEGGFPKWKANIYRAAVYAFGPQKWGV